MAKKSKTPGSLCPPVANIVIGNPQNQAILISMIFTAPNAS